MNESITVFIQKQTCATICCVDEQAKPYCFSCFYAFSPGNGLLYFKSSAETKHARLMKENPFVAGTILPDKLNSLAVKGIQFEGIVLDEHNSLNVSASGCYYNAHPLALAIPGEIWAIQINSIKMTDSTKLFGKKIEWKRREEDVLLLKK